MSISDEQGIRKLVEVRRYSSSGECTSRQPAPQQGASNSRYGSHQKSATGKRSTVGPRAENWCLRGHTPQPKKSSHVLSIPLGLTLVLANMGCSPSPGDPDTTSSGTETPIDTHATGGLRTNAGVGGEDTADGGATIKRNSSLRSTTTIAGGSENTGMMPAGGRTGAANSASQSGGVTAATFAGNGASQSGGVTAVNIGGNGASPSGGVTAATFAGSGGSGMHHAEGGMGLGSETPIAAGGTPTSSNTAPTHTHDHCVEGEGVDGRDSQISSTPDRWVSRSGAIDLVLPNAVLDWMTERAWQPSHDAWHNVRRCQSGAPLIGGGVNSICTHSELVPDHQECEDAEDGYQFLVMHRHMLQSLKQAFPQHADLFSGFPRFPMQATDVPAEWRDRWGTGWSEEILGTAKLLEAVESHLAEFATEGDLGKFIQCGSAASAASSIHGALHFKWVVNDSPHSLGKQPVNIENYMFWKLHGWIDTIWERYRKVKGLAPDELKLTQALTAQCREMHALGGVVGIDASPGSGEPLPTERGYFHEKVRPILEKTCSGCHSESSPQAGLPLGGRISSAEIVKALVDMPTMYGGQFKRVVAGSPDQSWFYLKPAGLAASAGCTASSCNNGVMPPTGKVTLTSAELGSIRQWIVDGAPAPTTR